MAPLWEKSMTHTGRLYNPQTEGIRTALDNAKIKETQLLIQIESLRAELERGKKLIYMMAKSYPEQGWHAETRLMLREWKFKL